MEAIRRGLVDSIQLKEKILNNTGLLLQIEKITHLIIQCFTENGSVYFCGNGGSAADAQHLAAELSGRFYFDRQPLPADALHCNTSFLTAVANDYSYDEIYARLIQGIGKEKDILFGLSTSGKSRNIVRAFEEARSKNIKTVAMTGKSGGELARIADICLCVPSEDTPRIQEAHITIGHIICEIVEANLFSKQN